MSIVDISCDISSHGAILDGIGNSIMDRFAQHAEEVIAQEAVLRIRTYLPTQYMYLGHNGGTPEFNPVPVDAGKLQAAIHSKRESPNVVMVTDTPVTYGPWIEGVSTLNLIVWPHRRNPPPRRFPGYHTFRIIGQQLESDAGAIAESALPPYLSMLSE